MFSPLCATGSGAKTGSGGGPPQNRPPHACAGRASKPSVGAGDQGRAHRENEHPSDSGVGSWVAPRARGSRGRRRGCAGCACPRCRGSGRVERDAAGLLSCGLRRRAAVAGEARRAAHARDRSRWCRPSRTTRTQRSRCRRCRVAVRCDRHVDRVFSDASVAGPPSPLAARGAGAGDGRDHAGGVDAADAVVARVGDVECCRRRRCRCARPGAPPGPTAAR